ncbi:hypothetical protein [Dactylosporangium sp. CA-233914]|uniref:hypothetical protein n=1 Tax=Dactylosporangium sp. CA-233914 TaxID=3239934 RepID=UPI003D9385D6
MKSTRLADIAAFRRDNRQFVIDTGVSVEARWRRRASTASEFPNRPRPGGASVVAVRGADRGSTSHRSCPATDVARLPVSYQANHVGSADGEP